VPVSLVVDGEITVTGASEDSLGQWDETIPDRGKHLFAVNVSHLPAGLYLVQLSNDHFSTTLKFIKP
jgi:hypothetical protein